MARYRDQCTCGSGKEAWDLTDAAGIFCCYVCDDCEAEKVKRHNPAIFQSGRYAATGEEADIDFWADQEVEGRYGR